MRSIIWVWIVFVTFCQCVYSSEQVRKKIDSNLAQRVNKLTHMSVKHPVMIFNNVQFHTFVKTTPRSYSIVVLFTAMAPTHKCIVCQYIYHEFQIVANSFRFSKTYSNKLFFAVLDIDEGRNVLQMLKIHQVPVLIHFPPKGKPKIQDTMNIQKAGFDAEIIAKWIAERTDIQIRVARPASYSISTLKFIMLFAIVSGILYLKQNNLNFFFDANIWGTTSMLFCFAMVSGHMWNVINSAPFFHQTQHTTYSQSVLESCIVMALSSASSLGMILMIKAEHKDEDNENRRIMAIIGVILYVLCFSLVLSMFKAKYHNYPYSLLN